MSQLTTYQPTALEVPTPQLKKAAATWMGLVFALCYMGVPFATDALGLFAWSGANFMMGGAGFVAMLALTWAAISVKRPRVHLHQDVRDPVIAATAGGLGMWAIIHTVGFGLLTPLYAMAPAELLTFIGMNVVESALFGMMLASFSKNRLQAFVLGAGFQAAFMITSMIALVMGLILI